MNPDSSHEKVNTILPWYANGTTSTPDRALVERHLEDCAECREELAFLQEVGAAAADLARATPGVQESLAETNARIDEWERTRTPTLAERVSGFVAGIWNPHPLLARSLVVVNLGLMIALGGAVVVMRQQTAGFTTLSGGASNSDGPRLTVMFQPGATEATLRQALLDAGASLVAGPSVTGVYVVQLPLSANDDAGVDAVIARLRADATIVRFVERQP